LKEDRSMTYDREADRLALLEKTLAHAPFDGWSQRALEAGASDAGVPLDRMLNAFPGGMAELLDFYHRVADRRMLDAMEAAQTAAMRVRDRIAFAVRARLEQNIAHREAIRSACSFLSMPQNLGLGARCLYRTVDAIWHAAGDRSTDHNFYTKRGLLAGVYGSTVLFWLNDKSVDQSATWDFLDRRIGEVMSIPKAMSGLKSLADRLPNPLRVVRRLRANRRDGFSRSYRR
jgi:ubiquinone biosynthesis protein COQ9